MSQENVEIVLRSMPGPTMDFAELLRNDAMWERWAEVVAALFDREVECVLVGVPGGDRTYFGMPGVRAALLEWYAPWATYRVEVTETRDLGDRVMAFVDNFGRLAGSTAEIKLSAAGLWTVLGGKICRAAYYADRAAALKDVGLAE